MIPIAPTPSTVEISPGVTVVLVYGKPASYEEAIRRFVDCIEDPRRIAPLCNALESIDAQRIPLPA